MRLSFVSAILPELSLDQVLEFASRAGYDAVEVMCWPVGKAERRYAGVTHIDVSGLSGAGAARVSSLLRKHRVGISGLGYYPNPLCPSEKEAAVYIGHIKKVISAARLLDVKCMNTFAGRDPARSLEDNWKVFGKRWPPIVRHAEKCGVRIGIENCPMYFSADEWPGGKNIANCPANWRRMFKTIPGRSFGLNYDPSHMVWQQMDYLKPLREFSSRIFHLHAKDVRVDRDRLDEVGTMATPLEYHAPKLPGLGEVNWGRFFSVLTDTGYQGDIAVEVEDRAYEGSLARRQAALLQAARYLRGFIG